MFKLASIHAVERKAAEGGVIYNALVLKNMKPDRTLERDGVEKLGDLRIRKNRLQMNVSDTKESYNVPF